MIDASIPLQAQAPQNPLAQYGQALALQNAMQQNRMGNLQVQQQENEMADQQKLKQAYSEAQGDLIQTEKNAIRLGVGPNTLMKVKQQLLEQRSKIADIDDKELKVKKEHTDAIGSAAQSVLQLPAESRQAAWASNRAALIQQGRIKPEEAPEQYPGDEAVQGFANTARTSQQIIESVLKEREAKARETTAATGTAREAREGEKQTFELGQKKRLDLAAKLAATKSQAEYQQILGAAPFEIAREFAGKTPEQARQLGLTAEQQTQAAQSDRTFEQVKENNTANRKIAAGHLAVDRDRLTMQREQAGFEQSGGISSVARSIANGDYNAVATQRALAKNPGLMAQIKQVDPDFSELDIDKRSAVLKEFTSSSNGKAGGQVTALNTLVHHADLYKEVGAALKNGSFKPGNALYNKVADMFGSAPPSQANLVARFLAGETGKVATGGVPAEGEINGILHNLGNNSSPEQLEQAGSTLLQIAAGRMVPLREKVEDAKLGKLVKILGPDAESILQKNGYDPKTMKKAAQGGAFKANDSRTIDGVKYVRDEKGNWHSQ